MKKVLVSLLGLILIGILTYACFEGKVGTIKEELESQANIALTSNQLTDVKAQLIGEGFATTTVMKLAGSVSSAQEKEKAAHLVEDILGVTGVDNQLKVATKVLEKPAPQVIEQPVIEQPMIEDVIPPQSAVVETPIPYLFDAIKESDGKLLLSGYVNSEDDYKALIDKAYELFGKSYTIDNLKVAQGAPKNWGNMTHLGLEKLKYVDQGAMKLYNTDYAFNGHLSSYKSAKIKSDILKDANQTMSKYNNFSGNFEISIPKPKTKKADTEKEKTPKAKSKEDVKLSDSKLCQKALLELSSRQKILFEYNKADIKKDSLESVNNVVKVLKRCQLSKTEIIEVGGHTDSIGNAPFNKKLSQKRADSVKEYLIKQGIDKSKIKAHGYGEKAPIVSNMLKAGRAKNRRIEFNIKETK